MAKQKVIKTDQEWREQLTPEQYHITRQKGTERPFTGEYYNSKEEGVYAPHRGVVRRLRRPFGPRLRRRAGANPSAPLHQLGGAKAGEEISRFSSL